MGETHEQTKDSYSEGDIHIPAHICMTFGVLEINTEKEHKRSTLWSC